MASKNTILSLARHAKADKLEGQPDADRSLAEIGVDKSFKMGQRLAKGRLPMVAFVSSATRAQQTWEHMLRGMGNPEIPTFVLPELYLPGGEDGKLMDEMFEELQYAPLWAYKKHQHAAVLDRWAETAGKKIEECLKKKFGEETPNDIHVIVVGHAVMQNALGLSTGDISDEARALLMGVSIPEAGVIQLALNEGESGPYVFTVN